MLRSSVLLLALACCWQAACAQPAACPAHLSVATSSVPDARNKDDTPIGRVLDKLLTEIARRAGTQFDTRFMPRVRAFAELRQGRVDLVPMAARTVERDGYAQMVPMGRLKAMLVVRKQFPSRPHSVDDIMSSGMRLLMVRGQEFGPRFVELIAQLTQHERLEIVGDQLIAVRMLKAGRVDALIGLPTFFTQSLAQEGLLDQVEIADTDMTEPIDEGLYMSLKIPAACRARLMTAGSEVRSSGFYRKLLDRVIPASQRAAFLDY